MLYFFYLYLYFYYQDKSKIKDKPPREYISRCDVQKIYHFSNLVRFEEKNRNFNQ